MSHTFNPATQGVEAGGSGVQVYPWLYKELKANHVLHETLLQKAKTKVRILAVGRVLAYCVQSLALDSVNVVIQTRHQDSRGQALAAQ